MISKKKITKISPIDTTQLTIFRNRFFKLGKGESELILIATDWQKQNKEFYCIIDDNEARKIAELFKLRCVGTIGLLLKLKENNQLNAEELEKYFKKLEQAGFRYNFKKIIK